MKKIAIVQESPILLNREKTIELAIGFIEQAAANGAKLVVFPETFISGYPAWMWRLSAGDDLDIIAQLHTRLINSAVDLESDDLLPLCNAAKKNGVTIVCGLNEKDGELSRGTIYNTVVIIGEDGNILNRHRKLMPTNPERMVHGFGDGSGLNVVDTAAGKIGALVCWENFMPLARYALYSQGVEVYVAPTYDNGDGWIGSMQHIAREGRCWVVSSGTIMTRDDILSAIPELASLYEVTDQWINTGDSVVVAPGGEIVAGPMHKEKGLLYADIDLDAVAPAKRTLDVTGHYSRPDVFTLNINTQAQSPVKFD